MDILQQYFFKDDNTPPQGTKAKAVLYKDIENQKKKKKVHFEIQKNSEGGKEKDGVFVDYLNREKRGSQIKILMTKEEALGLLSKCQDGGVLNFKDVANHLAQIPRNRVSLQIPSHNIADVVSCKKDR